MCAHEEIGPSELSSTIFLPHPVLRRRQRHPFRQYRIYCLAITCAPLVDSAARQRWFVLTNRCFSPCSFSAWRPSVSRSWPSRALLNPPRYSGTVVASHAPFVLRPAPSTCLPRHASLRAPCAHMKKSAPVHYNRRCSSHPAILARVPVLRRRQRHPFRQYQIYCLAIPCAPLVDSAARQRWFVLTNGCFSPCSFSAWRPSVSRSWPSRAPAESTSLVGYRGGLTCSPSYYALLRAPVFPGTRACVRHVRT
ncbi:hypothetical protein MTO96_035549 [Rhipicephalus appendiculatus]